jgi:tetratricopeptide (TPR) repeat protein
MGAEDINIRIRALIDSAVHSIGKEDFENAIEDLKAAEVLDKDNPEVIYNLGISHSRQGLHKTAVTYYWKLMDLPFEFVELRNVKKMLSYSLILGESYEEALSVLAQILRITPMDATSNGLCGYCYEKLGRLDESIASHRKVLDVEPSNINSCNSLAFLLARRGSDLDEALTFARRALASNPESPAYCDTIGYVYMKRKQPELAKKFMKQALEKAPASLEIRSHLSELLKI